MQGANRLPFPNLLGNEKTPAPAGDMLPVPPASTRLGDEEATTMAPAGHKKKKKKHKHGHKH